MNKILILLCCLLLIMTSCEKDYLDEDQIEFSITMPDTISLSSPVKIKGTINQNLKMKVFRDLTGRDSTGDMSIIKEYQFGEFNPPVDSLSFNPKQENLIAGKYYRFWLVVTFKASKSQTSSLGQYKYVYVKE